MCVERRRVQRRGHVGSVKVALEKPLKAARRRGQSTYNGDIVDPYPYLAVLELPQRLACPLEGPVGDGPTLGPLLQHDLVVGDLTHRHCAQDFQCLLRGLSAR